MKNQQLFKKILVLSTILLLAGGIVSCTASPESRVSVWIDSPHDGVTLPEDATVTVLSHAYAREGIGEAVLYVDSTAYRRESPAEVGAEFSDFSFEWLPPGPGDYALQVWVYDILGEAGGPATVYVHVGAPLVIEFGDTNTPTPLPPITFTPTPTPVITFTPTPTWIISVTPPQPTYTPTPLPQPPDDNTPPPVPTPMVPADGLALSCRTTQVLNWLPVQDPSGIAGYYVKLQWEQTAGNWVNAGGYGPISGKQIEVSVDCGVRYRWMVRAEDNEGNVSNWSSPSRFSINIG